MKYGFSFLFISALFLGCNYANEEDFENLAVDMCDCFSDVTSELSPRGTEIFLDAANEGSDYRESFKEYMSEDPDAAYNDQIVLLKMADKKTTKCIKNLEKRYKKLYSLKTEKEIQKELIQQLDGKKGCELTQAIAKMSLED